MKVINGLLTIFLVFGFLMVPTGVFAQDNYQEGSDSISKYISPSMVLGSSLTPQVKGSSGGKSSSSSKIKTDDDDTADGDGSLGSYWWIILLILLGVIGIILLWYFFLRK